MLSPNWKLNTFEADSEGPPKRKLCIWQDEPRQPSDPPIVVSGWGFGVSEFDAKGAEQPFWDTWERTLEDILRYPPEYAPRSIVWRRSANGEVIDIYALKN